MEIDAVAGVKAQQAPGDVARGAPGEVLPGVAFVPHEIVQHRGFHGQRGGHQVVPTWRALKKQGEGAHLDHDAERAHEVELEPADRERRHGRRSAS